MERKIEMVQVLIGFTGDASPTYVELIVAKRGDAPPEILEVVHRGSKLLREEHEAGLNNAPGRSWGCPNPEEVEQASGNWVDGL